MVMVDTDPTDAASEWSHPARLLLATLLAAAGVIHLVMVPSHAQEWLPEGIGFGVAGWLQIGLAAVVLTRPSRLVLQSACLAGIAFVAVWAVAQVRGLPVGPEAGVAHEAAFVDITCVALEVAAVVVGYVLLARPQLLAVLGTRARVLLSVVPLGILVLATTAVASPSARGHGHEAGNEAAGHPHGEASESAAGGGHGHEDEGDPADGDDKGLSLLMNGQGDGGGHAHEDEVVELDPATQGELDAQLAKTQQFVERYPTVADAEAAGYHRMGPFSPGLGAHYMAAGAPRVAVDLTMTDEALENPTIIYDGIDPDSKIAGFMYNIYSTDTENPPEGFAGPNDGWHYHTNVCLVFRPDGGVDAPLGADTSAPKDLCDEYGGQLLENTGYMAHVWTVPGYESPQGTFSNVNANITCPNGTYYVVDMEDIGTRSNVCRDVPH